VLLIVGTTAATLAIPHDVTGVGALTLSGWLLFLSLIAPTLPSWRNDVRSLLRGENLLIGALVYWTLTEVLQGSYSVKVSRDAVVKEYVLLATTALGFWIGANAHRPMAPRFVVMEALRPWAVDAIFRILLISFVLGIWDFLYRSDFDIQLILASLSTDRWSTPWQRESLGDWSAFSYHLQYFGYLVPALTVLLAVRVGWRNPKTLVGIVMSCAILTFHTQGGGRRIVGAIVLAALFCWLINAGKLNVRRTWAVLGALAGLTALLQLMLIYRGVGFGDESRALSHYDYVFIDDNFLRIAQTIEFVPDVQPYVGFQYILFALVRPVPRVLWPGKPVDGGFDLAELVGVPDTSFAITAAGEFYVSYGFFAAFLGAYVYGRLSSMVNFLFEQRQKVNPVFPAIMLVWLFVGVRSMLEIMLMGYVLLAIIALSKAARFLDSLRASAPFTRRHLRR
jgi:oligosaccharide repeat unit polymerase